MYDINSLYVLHLIDSKNDITRKMWFIHWGRRYVYNDIIYILRSPAGDTLIFKSCN